MKYCKKILDYYLVSECYFKIIISWFFDLFNHYGKCEYNEKTYFFESKLYRQIKQREKAEFGFKIIQDNVYHYFTTNYTDEQLFAIIFAYWCGINDNQIKQIADRRSKKTWGNPNSKKPSANISLSNYKYDGIYLIFDNCGNEYEAEYIDDKLKIMDTNIYYKILN